MYSPWTTSMPCLFSNNTNINCRNHQQEQQFNSSYNSNDCLISSLNNLDLSNPFNMVATKSPVSSVWSLNNLNYYHYQINEQQQQQHKHELKNNYFEPLPFIDAENQLKQNNYPQLSQKHAIIKQMIARKTKQQQDNHHRSHYNSCDNIFSSTSDRKKRHICSFCKTNGESASVYTSHVLRNIDNEIECPILMAYVCPKCGATGKSAHTIKYCTALSEGERVALPTVKLFKEGRSSSGNMNLFKK
ncbi:unnamed protein product [Rotaria sp. Silwood2]|nr:unnamed protein product [Rotaria sp. Silwood2]CAF2496211.1 unnamed protein product [Rotaria sp. Silwood2]CAF2878439.1 unnamed protein product [Rotaria sp. Silwood2]CAF2900938.1 unnamed protein product [Rotaria sp. Silwood2]CAF4004264.1 unnamed protein product [Rotaria sp. Silwood2]